jgi:hypothetical protein
MKEEIEKDTNNERHVLVNVSHQKYIKETERKST